MLLFCSLLCPFSAQFRAPFMLISMLLLCSFPRSCCAHSHATFLLTPMRGFGEDTLPPSTAGALILTLTPNLDIRSHHQEGCVEPTCRKPVPNARIDCPYQMPVSNACVVSLLCACQMPVECVLSCRFLTLSLRMSLSVLLIALCIVNMRSRLFVLQIACLQLVCLTDYVSC